MKQLYILIAVLLFSLAGKAQIYQKNSTWYEWSRARVNDQFRIPRDTLAAADSGSIATKNGVLYVKMAKWEIVGGSNYSAGYGLNLSGSTFKADSTAMATRARLKHVTDSLAALINASAAGEEIDPVFNESPASTITDFSINQWDDAYGGTITGLTFNTSTGVITATKNNLSTLTVDIDGRFLLGVDTLPLSARINDRVKYADTAAMLANYARKESSLLTLTDGATVTWNYSLGNEARVTIAGNRTLSITNLPAGKVVYGTISVIQDPTGGRTFTLPAGSKVGDGGAGAVTLSTAGGTTDMLSFRWNGTTLFWLYKKNFN